MTSRSSLNQRLVWTRDRLQRRALAALTLRSVGLLAALLLLLEACERIAPLREQSAFFFTLAALALGVLFFGWHLFRLVRRAPQVTDVARAVERVHPDLLDSLSTAAELEQRPKEKRRVLERAAVRKAEEDTATLDFLQAALPSTLAARNLLKFLVLFVPLFILALNGRVLGKAGWFVRASMNPQLAGLRVTPQGTDAPKHSDVTIRASIRRWQHRAGIRYVDASGETWYYPMNSAGDGEFEFTFYDVTDPVDYRVETPSLASRWYRLSVFDPPRIQAVEITITPPAYTGLEPRTLNELTDTSAVTGSRIAITLDVRPEVDAELRSNQRRLTFRSEKPGTLACDFTLREARTWTIHLKDRDGHRASSAAFRLESIPDLEPVLDVLRPGRDIVARPETNVGIQARAGDDFGLSEIRISWSVSGGERQSLPLFRFNAEKTQGPVTDHSVQHVLDLAELEADKGDVISYTLTAADNRQPEPQRVRSDVFFIEVRPEIVPEESPEGAQKQRLDLHNLLAELKRLIRMSYDIASYPSDTQEDAIQDLHSALADLKTAATRQLNKVKTALPPGKAGDQPLFQVFQGAIQDIDIAERLTGRELVEDAIPPQERALSALTSIAQELMKHSGKGGNGQSDKQKQERSESSEQQKQAAQPKSFRQQLEELNDLLGKVSRLADRQSAMNQRLGDLRDSEPGPSEKRELAQRQTGIREETDSARQQISPEGPMRRIRNELRKSADAMDEEMPAIEQGETSRARRHGKRAHASLLSAAGMLRDQIRKLSAARVEALAQQAEALSRQQREAARKSRQATETPPEEKQAKSLRSSQEELGRRAGGLMDVTERTAAEFEQDYPEAASAIAEAVRGARRENVQGKMKRAENAMLYERYDRAGDFQTEAANSLLKLAGDLRKASDALPNISQQELLEALQQTREARERLRRAAQKEGESLGRELRRTTPQMAELFDRLGRAMESEELRQVSGSFSMLPQAGTTKQQARRAAELLEAAARFLKQRILAAETQRTFNLNRKTTSPPEKYRSLIEEYFKSLSEEP